VRQNWREQRVVEEMGKVRLQLYGRRGGESTGRRRSMVASACGFNSFRYEFEMEGEGSRSDAV
jgi:hypothetical protein